MGGRNPPGRIFGGTSLRPVSQAPFERWMQVNLNQGSTKTEGFTPVLGSFCRSRAFRAEIWQI